MISAPATQVFLRVLTLWTGPKPFLWYPVWFLTHRIHGHNKVPVVWHWISSCLWYSRWDTTMLVSCGCCKKLSCICWLKTTNLSFLSSSGQSPKPGWEQDAGRAALWRLGVMVSSSLLPAAAGLSWLACSCISPISQACLRSLTAASYHLHVCVWEREICFCLSEKDTDSGL